MSTTQDVRPGKDPRRLRIRNAALGLATVALAFYFGIIALLIFRGHH
jgi:hypothetical protein